MPSAADAPNDGPMPRPRPLPRRYDPREVEARWRPRWEERGVYRFRPDADAPTYSIDTPPPTVSGRLHVGHAFSYTHTDIVARHRRMRGFSVFYPMGWDDNGLPSERRVERLLRVRCDPSLPYDADFTPDPDGPVTPVSRANFLELCARVTAEDERAYEELWRRLGLSVDWSRTYTTVGPESRRAAQLGFLRLVRTGEAYATQTPTLWDVEFRTAVAQAECEMREAKGREFLLRFGLEGGGTLRIMTTRPELVGACVAVAVHPEDPRHAGLVGRRALTPGYHAPVPIMADSLADPEVGTGALMVCSFGDVTDLAWWREHDLPLHPLIGRDGRILPARWGAAGWPSLWPEAARQFHAALIGLPVEDARDAVAREFGRPEAAADAADTPPLEGEPRRIRHEVRFYEKGSRPLEIVSSRQWFIRIMDKRRELLELGRRVQWHPPHMRVRYERWVEGLRYDWCVSRQRYHGVPIPVWYRLDAEGRPDLEAPLLPDEADLPADPMARPPAGFTEDQRGRPGGFTADPDVLDTWATSSLTPRIACGWERDPALFDRLYPMDLRPQAHDIIRTWAFYTIARAHMLDGRPPWRQVAISGWVVDPDRRKMSKSVGNVVTPADLLDSYGADAVRHWAARARLGTDTAYDEAAFGVGKRLVTKLFNAAKLIVGRLDAAPEAAAPVLAQARAPLDRAYLGRTADVVRRAGEHMEVLETAAALETIEDWFWTDLCDNYLELSKERAYAADPSALAAWELSLSGAARLLAPFVPYVTEEVWSWRAGAGGESVHRAPWPRPEEFAPPEHHSAVLDAAVEALGQLRRHRTEHGLSRRAPIQRAVVRGPGAVLAALEGALGDLQNAGAVEQVELAAGGASELQVEFP